MRTTWVRYLILALICEKIIQHVVVTLAFALDWKGIGSIVAVSPVLLMIAGALVALFFVVCLWGMIAGQKWAFDLVIALAVVDLLGEFLAQGTIGIVITLSFLVAATLLILGLIYRRQGLMREA
jgi:hypothetical protein